MLFLLTSCVFWDVTPTPTIDATFTPDACTGWWCNISEVVYGGKNNPGNELDDANVILNQISFCSPTSGLHEAITSADGRFEFDQMFLHDTDGVRIMVESEGYEPAYWETGGFECLSCGCFNNPVEFVLMPILPEEITAEILADCFIDFHLSAWQDLNCDGYWDDSEPPLSDVAFRIDGIFASMLSKYPCISNEDGQCTMQIWSPGLCVAREYTFTADPPEFFTLSTPSKMTCSLTSKEFSCEAAFGFCRSPEE